jgi:hypothetical protein
VESISDDTNAVHDEKYIVFPRDAFKEMMSARAMNFATAVEHQQAVMGLAIGDAVVIRRQDLFAGPALHTYSNSMAMATRMISEGEEQKRLMRIADYFHEQAVAADAEGWKLPD